MKKLIVAIALALVASTAYAYCYTNTVYGPNGQVTVCTTCCYSGSCTTTCF